MDKTVRKPFEGVLNVIKFNRHFYILAILLVVILVCFGYFVNNKSSVYYCFISLLIFVTMFVSLVVTYYVYDYSNLYSLHYLDDLHIASTDKLVNINAGFDEFSLIICEKFDNKNLQVFDF